MKHAFALVLMFFACGKRREQPPVPLASAASASAIRSAAPMLEPSADASEAGEPPMASPARPPVSLSGKVAPLAPLGDGPKVGAIAWVVRVHKTPRKDGKVLGFLRGGAVVAATADSARPTRDCPGGWQGVLPGGFVCKDEITADLAHPILRLAARRPDFAERLPYMVGIATSGGPVYARIPSPADLARYEPNLDQHLAKWRADEQSGARFGLDVWLRYEKSKDGDALALFDQKKSDDDVPELLLGNKPAPNLSGLVAAPDAVKIAELERRQGRSFIDTFLIDGRRYNLTPDLTIIPADRFRPIHGSEFHGFAVAEEGILPPFAIIRRQGARKWTWSASKKSMQDGGELAWRSLVMLTKKQKFYDNVLHFETKDGFYVDDRHASRVDPAKRWPKWAQQGAKWIDINLTKQVLVAYEGEKMVYATLISSGEDGLADPDTAKKATVHGIYRIHTKWLAATMDSKEVGEEFELRDVPYVQYFKEGYALHGAYWHDRFGTPKSHGCVNLSPDDARRLFFWTEPAVPAGWHGAVKSLTGTVVFIHP